MNTGRIVCLILGSVLFAGGLSIIIVQGQTSQLKCNYPDSSRVMCVTHSKWLGLVQLKEQVLGEAQEAWVDEDCDSERCTYQLNLRTSTGNIYLDGYSSDWKSKEKTAGRINAYVKKRSEETLEVVVNNFWDALIASVGGGIFFAAGVTLLAAVIMNKVE